MSAEENLKAAILSKIVANIEDKISEIEKSVSKSQLKIKIFSDLKYNRTVIKTKNMINGKIIDLIYDCLLKGFEDKELDFTSNKLNNKIFQVDNKDLILLKDFLEKNSPTYANIYKNKKIENIIMLAKQGENNIEL